MNTVPMCTQYGVPTQVGLPFRLSETRSCFTNSRSLPANQACMRSLIRARLSLLRRHRPSLLRSNRLQVTHTIPAQMNRLAHESISSFCFEMLCKWIQALHASHALMLICLSRPNHPQLSSLCHGPARHRQHRRRPHLHRYPHRLLLLHHRFFLRIFHGFKCHCHHHRH